MNQNDLYIEYARVIKMCNGTALENKPWLCVKFNGTCIFDTHPSFTSNPELYEFAVAILEDRPVFPGDILYLKSSGLEYVADKYTTASAVSDMTWQPPKPKRRIVLEETGKTGQPEVGEYVFNNGNLCLCRKPERWGNEHEIWRIVEDTGNKP